MSNHITSAAVSAGVALSAVLAVGATTVPAQSANSSTGAAAQAAAVPCAGSQTSCSASVSLAGGASNKKARSG